MAAWTPPARWHGRTVALIESTFESTRPNTLRLGTRKPLVSGWCPRQDSNLRSRLRRPVDLVIADVFWRPTWSFCSPFCVFSDLPCAVVRSTIHPTTNVLLGQLEEASCLAKSA